MLLFKRTANQRNGTSRGAGGGQHGSGGMAAIPPDSDITVSELVSWFISVYEMPCNRFFKWTMMLSLCTLPLCRYWRTF